MSFNPYEPPSSAFDGAFTNQQAGAVVTEAIVSSLRKTRPWVVFIAVVGFVFSGFAFIGGIGMMTQMPGIGFAYLIGAAIGLIPAIAMIRYGTAINKLLHGGGVPELEQAVDAQASFWQIAGILTLVYIVLVVLMVVVGASMAGSMMRGF